MVRLEYNGKIFRPDVNWVCMYVCMHVYLVIFIYIIDKRDRLYVFETLLLVKMVEFKSIWNKLSHSRLLSKKQLFLIMFSVQLNNFLSLLRLMGNFRINQLHMADDLIRITASAIVRLHQIDECHNHVY